MGHGLLTSRIYNEGVLVTVCYDVIIIMTVTTARYDATGTVFWTLATSRTIMMRIWQLIALHSLLDLLVSTNNDVTVINTASGSSSPRRSSASTSSGT